VRLGCKTRRLGEANALLEVREEALQSKSFSTDKAAGVYGIAEIGFSLSVGYMLQNAFPDFVVIGKSPLNDHSTRVLP
jgi:hypothetical protein